MPGSTPATSQLDWLSSTTAMIVLSWSKATRDLLKSCSWGITALRQLFASDDGAISSSPAPYHLLVPPKRRQAGAAQVGAGMRSHAAEAASRDRQTCGNGCPLAIVAGPAELRLIDSSEMPADLRDADECH